MARTFGLGLCRQCRTSEGLIPCRDAVNRVFALCGPCHAGEPTHHWCSCCKERRLISRFHVKRRAVGSPYQSTCKDCTAVRMREWYAKYPYYQTERKFGLAPGEYAKMLTSQKSQCAICGVSREDVDRNFPVDHNHETGKVRGLLCHHCNSLLGYAEDDIGILEAAIAYLKEHS